MKTSSFFQKPHTAEALALLAATQFGCDLGFKKFILEGDALPIVKQIQLNIKDWSEGGLVVQDSIRLLNGQVQWSISHVKREGNVLEHVLANSALSLENE